MTEYTDGHAAAVTYHWLSGNLCFLLEERGYGDRRLMPEVIALFISRWLPTVVLITTDDVRARNERAIWAAKRALHVFFSE